MKIGPNNSSKNRIENTMMSLMHVAQKIIILKQKLMDLSQNKTTWNQGQNARWMKTKLVSTKGKGRMKLTYKSILKSGSIEIRLDRWKD